MSDLISRQAAIDALDEIEAEVADGYGYQYAKWREYFVEMPSAQHEIFFLLESEPSADVAPVMHAHVVWTRQNISYQTQCCSNCHRTFISRPDETIEFCPHCGAKMDEEKESEHD